MTTFLLVRHAEYPGLGRILAGRAPGYALSATGESQAASLAARLCEERIDAVYSSPVERAVATARPIAAGAGVSVRIDERFTEFDFGDWTGLEIAALDRAGSAEWQRFNTERSTTRAPGGEHPSHMQERVLAALAALAELGGAADSARIVVVSHADPIRAALTHFLGMPLEHGLRLELSPAGVSSIQVTQWGTRVLAINAEGARLPA